MSMPKEKLDKRYTYTDYLTWTDGERYEIIDGIIYAMSPAPSRIHQEIAGEIFSQLHMFLKGKPCKVFIAPFDVRLNASDDDDTVVQPDITIVCDKSKLDDKGCKGVPDMVIEVLSPSTSSHDKVLKFDKYLKVGVREYWIVSPDDKTVSVHVLDNGRYVTTAYGETATAPVNILEGCMIRLTDVFAEE